MERLYIRGRLLELFEEQCDLDSQGWNGEPAFAVGPEELAGLIESEFGVSLSPELLPDVLTVNWLVEVVHELASDDDGYIM